MIKQFKRGIDKAHIKIAKAFFEESSVGKAICEGVKQGDLYVCIRENYFNVYRNGCSLLKYSPNASKHKFLIHKKYWDGNVEGIPLSGKYYLSLKLEDGKENTQIYIESIIKKPNRKLEEYLFSKNKSGDSEKELLQAYLKSESPCLMDLETAFSCKTTKQGGKRDTVAKRVDLATLEKRGSQTVLFLTEAKVVSDTRLTAEQGDPEVINQLKTYEAFLTKEKDNIFSSYKRIAENYIEIFPDLLGDKERELMSSFLVDGGLAGKPTLLLLAKNGDIKSSLQDNKKRDHYGILNDACNDHQWGFLEWVK